MTFDHIMEEIGIAKYLKNTATIVGRKGYNPVNMLKTILFGFMDKVEFKHENVPDFGVKCSKIEQIKQVVVPIHYSYG